MANLRRLRTNERGKADKAYKVVFGTLRIMVLSKMRQRTLDVVGRKNI